MTLTLLDIIVLEIPDTIIVDDFNIHSHQSINHLDKNIQGKKEIKLSFIVHKMVLLYLKDSKDSSKFVDMVNNFSKVGELRVNIQKSTCQ